VRFDLTPEQERCREAAREFARDIVAPAAVDIDRDNRCPSAVLAEAGRRRLLSIAVPRDRGGAGSDFASAVVAVEAIAYQSAGVALLIATENLASHVLHAFGAPEQQERWSKRLGEAAAAAILVWRAEGHSIRAEPSGDGLRLNGDAGLVPGAATASVFIVAADAPGSGSPPSLGLLVAAAGGHILRVPAPDPLGARGAGWAGVRFEDLEVAPTDRLRAEVGGADLATWIMNRGRLLMAAVALGVGQASLDWAIGELRAGAVHDSQAVRFTLADVAVQLDAGRVLTMKAATEEPAEGCDAGAAMAKLTSTDAARLVTDRMLELTGARGFTREAVIERLWRDARAVDVLLGSTYAQRRTIGREILNL
jgi:alkylation response protein AidB-like acyl-CoA dehydrogenase